MSLPARRVAAAALAACLIAVAVVVLWPSHLDVTGVYRDADDVLAPLRQLGLPSAFLNPNALEFAGNIAMFVPLALLGTLALPRRLWWLAPLACLVLSCGIETTQLLFLPGRTFAVRDIIGNTLGGVLGTALALLAQAVMDAARRRRGA